MEKALGKWGHEEEEKGSEVMAYCLYMYEEFLYQVENQLFTFSSETKWEEVGLESSREDWQ